MYSIIFERSDSFQEQFTMCQGDSRCYQIFIGIIICRFPVMGDGGFSVKVFISISGSSYPEPFVFLYQCIVVLLSADG